MHTQTHDTALLKGNVANEPSTLLVSRLNLHTNRDYKCIGLKPL